MEQLDSPNLFEAQHKLHCFIVMPFGRDKEERDWYLGWYKVVIDPTVRDCRYGPVLAAAEEQPGAINDEIRSHLAFDPMVVADLGGVDPSEQPNPNVMYELGIRHAFGLPVVIMGWEGQQLPFDVGNQRAIMSARGMIDIEVTRQKLKSFILSAQSGKFYNPMAAVGREAALRQASLGLGEDSILRALTDEVRELREGLSDRRNRLKPSKAPNTVKRLLNKASKAELWKLAQEHGIDSTVWAQFLALHVDDTTVVQARTWTLFEWSSFLSSSIVAHELRPKVPKASQPDEAMFERVRILLPAQPWPSGVHHEIAAKLNLTGAVVNKAIQVLISRGVFAQQHDGVVVDEVVAREL